MNPAGLQLIGGECVWLPLWAILIPLLAQVLFRRNTRTSHESQLARVFVRFLVSLALMVALPIAILFAVEGSVPGFAAGARMAFHLSVFAFGPALLIAGIFLLRPGTKAGRCAECGYDLTGNVSGICPECGRPVGEERHAREDDSV